MPKSIEHPRAETHARRVRFSPFPRMQFDTDGNDVPPSSASNFTDPGSAPPESNEKERDRSPEVAHLFINNERIMSRSNELMSVFDPFTQRLSSRVPCSTHREVQSAVNAAHAAQQGWDELGFQSRREYLLKFIDIAVLCQEVGKTTGEAESEIARGLDCIHAACSISPEMAGMYLGSDPTLLQTFFEPIGVCVSIIPFSFPFMTSFWSIPYALITGNTVVLKPSEKAPSVSHFISDAVLKTGFPRGVFNIVHGGYSVVQMLILQPRVQAVSFVGSESAAKQVHDIARKAGKRVQAECGGKNHGVILEDANMIPTLFAVAGSAFGAAGQRCMSLSVAVFVGNARDWIDKLVEIAQSMVVGHSGDKDVNIGPLIDRAAKAKVIGFIDRAIQEGAVLLCDGRGVEVAGYPEGNFIGPTILSGVETYMECYQSEIFGPVLICIEVQTLEEAIELINKNKYGNGCSIFTSAGKHARTFQRHVNVGQIGINIPLIAPYGTAVRTSNKGSFMGDRHTPGKTYWPFFTTTKTVSSRWDI
ncbi:Aldehyde/histidinol dehydrogenase [Aspergillus cavernicola]|uniref:Aldehyde/histidinol dehydrogenase n=1 Tax=Aspergillus cavernicola TaxID=176166 RepID=A0ABR4I0M5_9EURO